MTQLTKLGLFGAPSEQYVASPKRAPGTITKSIGTSSRDYSTISLWEADLDDATIYVSGDDAVGECYNDSDFDEALTIDRGATIGLNSIKLTAPTSERHDGTAGTGVRLLYNTGTSLGTKLTLANSSDQSIIEWLDFDANNLSIKNLVSVYNSSSGLSTIRNSLIHNIKKTSQATTGLYVGSYGQAHNCLVYNIEHTSTNSFLTDVYGINQSFNTSLYNNTVYNVKNAATSNCRGIYQRSTGTDNRNNISVASDDVDFFGSAATEDYNLSSDTTANGANSLTNKSAANQFVSIVSGSEDLHLKSGADAIGAGVDLGSSPAGVQYDIDGQDRDLFSSIVWDIGADQRTTPKTIGTAARDYSTIAAWEADLDNTAVYVAGDDAEGHCYNDSDFDEAVLINGGSTVGLSFIKLTSPAGERHDGTAGTGARILDSSPQTINITSSSLNTEVSYLEKDCNGTDNSYAIESHNLVGSNTKKTLQGMIVHNLVKSGATSVDGAGINIGSRTSNRTCLLMNSIIYNISSSTNALRFMAGVKVSISDTTATEIYNVTIHDIRRSLTGSCFGLHTLNTGDETVKNVIATDVIGIGASCFNTNINTTASTNLSSDSSATGTNSLVNENSVDEFVSIVSGSEDLHLKIGAKALNNGTDLGSTPAGVQYDLDGYDRSLSTTWDIGADESQLYDGPPEFNGFGGAGRMMMLGVG